jgi:hypothetical protein
VNGFHVRSVPAENASLAPPGTLEWVRVLTRTGRETGVPPRRGESHQAAANQ